MASHASSSPWRHRWISASTVSCDPSADILLIRLAPASRKRGRAECASITLHILVIGFARTSSELVCDGVPLSAVAQAVGTPAYVYSAAVLRERYRDLDEAFGDYPHAIHYAFKANSALALVRQLRALGSAVDAVSIWEVEVARAAGFEPSQIVFD